MQDRLRRPLDDFARRQSRFWKGQLSLLLNASLEERAQGFPEVRFGKILGRNPPATPPPAAPVSTPPYTGPRDGFLVISPTVKPGTKASKAAKSSSKASKPTKATKASKPVKKATGTTAPPPPSGNTGKSKMYPTKFVGMEGDRQLWDHVDGDAAGPLVSRLPFVFNFELLTLPDSVLSLAPTARLGVHRSFCAGIILILPCGPRAA